MLLGFADGLAEFLELCRDVVRASHKVLSRHHVLPEKTG